MNNKNYYKLAVFFLLTILVGSFTHCVQNSPIGGSSSSSSRTPSSTPAAETPEQVLNAAQLDVGLKNFEQINYTFSELTGVPVTQSNVSSTYNSVEATLPTETDLKVLQSANQVAITRLAAEYCSQLISNGSFTANRDAIFGAGFFSVIYTGLSTTQKANFIVSMTNSFWGNGIVEATELAAAQNELAILFDDIANMETTKNNTATTVKAAKGVCTAALSSAYVTIM